MTRLLGIITLLLCGYAEAQQHPVELQQVDEAKGLPHIRITSLFQDSEGILWCGTDLGLLRYDGSRSRWYRHDPDLADTIPRGKVRAIAEDPGGRLWVGTQGGLACMNRTDGTFERYPYDAEDGARLDSPIVWSLAVDAMGRVWVGTDHGLHLLEDGRVRRIAGSAFSNGVTTLEAGPEGGMWVGTDISGAGRVDARLHYRPLPLPKGAQVRAMHLQADGTLWVGTLTSGLFRFHPDDRVDHWPDGKEAPGERPTQIRALTTDPNGDLWVGTEDGLFLLRDGAAAFQVFRYRPGPYTITHSEILDLHLDRAGMLWVATAGGGLDTWYTGRALFSYYEFKEQGGALALGEDAAGRIWVGCRRGLARLDPATDERVWRHPASTIRAIMRHASGDLLVGTDQRLLRIKADTEDDRVLLEGRRIWRLAPHDDDAVWVGTNNGLFLFDLAETAVLETYTTEEGPRRLSNGLVSTIARHPEGDLLVGTYGGGLNRISRRDGSVVHYRKTAGDPDSLGADDVTHLLVDRSDRVWVATLSGGLYLMEAGGRFLPVGADDPQFPQALVSLAQDARGDIWVMSAQGLLRLDPDTFAVHRMSIEDGVISGSAVPGSALFTSSDGRMYFGGSDGAIGFSPRAVPRDHRDQAVPLVLTGLRKGNRETAHLAPAGGTIFLTPGDKTLSLDVSLLDFRAPGKSRIGYRRDDLDDGWVWTEGAHATINYTRYLSYGGKGVLHLKGIDHQGTETVADLVIEAARPAWIQWMPIWLPACLALLMLLLYKVVSFRERRKRKVLLEQARLAEQRRELAEQRALVAEQRNEVEQRERQLQEAHTAILQEHLEQVSTEIANDLHDGPLAALSGLGYHLRALSREQNAADMGSRLREVSDTLLPDVCGALRNVCGQLLLPDFRYGLITELESFADVIAGMHPEMTVVRHFPEEPRDLEPEAQAGLYRIFRTLLKNVGRHSGADTLTLSLASDEAGVRLEVVDNGCGFDVPDDWESFRAQKHYGMYMAAYFAEALGGSMQVTSRPGAGTRVVVALPRADAPVSAPQGEMNVSLP